MTAVPRHELLGQADSLDRQHIGPQVNLGFHVIEFLLVVKHQTIPFLLPISSKPNAPQSQSQALIIDAPAQKFDFCQEQAGREPRSYPPETKPAHGHPNAKSSLEQREHPAAAFRFADRRGADVIKHHVFVGVGFLFVFLDTEFQFAAFPRKSPPDNAPVLYLSRSPQASAQWRSFSGVSARR